MANTQKSVSIEWAQRLVAVLESRGLEVVVTPTLAPVIGRPVTARPLPDQWHDIELMIVLGGDGTLLGAAKAVAHLDTPVLGVNTGHLGFLTELEAEELFVDLDAVLSGEFRIEERMMLQAVVQRGDEVLYESTALNDAVITRGPLARMVHLSVQAEGTPVTDYAADGIIVSTATGSTAYALSAGGPIVHPDLQVLLVTPICPHTFNSRSLVIPASAGVSIEVLNQGEVLLTMDGQLGFRFQPGDLVRVERSPLVARLVRRAGYRFYDVLRRKLSEPSRKIGTSFGP